MSAPLLEIDGVDVRYGRIAALVELTLRVEEGEIVAMIGPNGAGKSSTLNAVAGIVRPSAGAIRFSGRNLAGRPLEEIMRRGVALAPEGRHIFGALTVLENLKLGATIRPDRAAAQAEIEAMCERFPILGQRRHAPAGRLSGGEQQMLAIARALLSRPRLLMLDEPSLGLAPKITRQIYEIVAAVRAQGVAVLVVEQNAERALGAADRAYVLNGGRVRLAGGSAALARDPDFEAAYFGLSSA